MRRRRSSRLRKKLPARSLGIASSRSGLRGHGLLPVPVAPGGAGVGPLAPLSTDPGGGLGLDQFLEQPFGDFADEFKTIR